MLRKPRVDHIVIEVSDYDDREAANAEALEVISLALHDKSQPGWSCDTQIAQRDPNEVLVLTVRCKMNHYDMPKLIVALVSRGQEQGHDLRGAKP